MPWYVGGRSETNLWESVLSFHHVGFWDQIQIIGLSNKICYAMSYFASLKTCWEWKFPLFVASRRGNLLVTLFFCTSCLLVFGLRKGHSCIHLLVIPHLYWVYSRLIVLFHFSRLSPRTCFTFLIDRLPTVKSRTFNKCLLLTNRSASVILLP